MSSAMNILSLVFLLLFSATAWAEPPAPRVAAPDISAAAYVLYDESSSQFLLEKSGDTRREPASLTKLMTAYLVFDALRRGDLTSDETLTVPAEALRHNGGEARMLLTEGQSVSVSDLLQGLIVQSASDAALTLAAHLGGETAFVAQMNAKARQLELNATRFNNPVGWAEAGHYSTAHDLALLAGALRRDFPQHYPLFSQREFTFNKITQANANRLLWIDPYTDGLKTGYSRTAGYCLIGSATRGNRRLVSVILGAPSETLRATESQALLNYGFQYFDAVRLYGKNQPVTHLRLWKGTENTIAIGFRNERFVTLPKGRKAQLKATVETRQPVLAPVAAGQPLGELKLTLNGQPYARFPLVALESVPLANVFSRGWDSIQLLFR
jgi:D-alanyl-D-alanine carboxypeptidase (penicillin-binding protein 5/6)